MNNWELYREEIENKANELEQNLKLDDEKALIQAIIYTYKKYKKILIEQYLH